MIRGNIQMLKERDAAGSGRKAGKEIDLKAVMERIREKADQRSFEEIPDFQEIVTGFKKDTAFDIDLLQDDIRKMTLGYKITPESSFVGNGMKGFLKRAVWRVNGFWVSQLAAQQSWFNNSAARGFIQTKNHILQQQDTIDMLRRRIARMERELEHLKENQDREI